MLGILRTRQVNNTNVISQIEACTTMYVPRSAAQQHTPAQKQHTAAVRYVPGPEGINMISFVLLRFKKEIL